MKKTMKLSVIVVLLLSSMSVLSEELSVILYKSKKSIVLEIDKSAVESRIKFSNTANHLFYTEIISKNQTFDKILDLKILPFGTYILEVENYLQITRYIFNVTSSEASMVAKNIGNKPVFKEKKQTLQLAFMNSDLNKVTIEVRDGFDRLLFNEVIERKEQILKTFNFEKAFKGYYTISIKNGNDTYAKVIEVF